jgi:glycosyltransferase involved in cell wall biosynthesis
VSIKRPGLDKIFSDHVGKVSDKWTIYVSEYERHFQEYRDRPVRLLEIGIQNGGSLEIWGKYFTRAKKLVGCDIDLSCKELRFQNKKISVVVGNANSDQIEKQILAKSKNFELVVDDGSHRSSDIVRSFARYFRHVADGGLYIAEDLHCSYWQQFEGGIFHPLSSISFFKALTDIINHQHWGVNKTRTKLLADFNREYEISLDEETLCHIHSIEFVNSMCVIRKADPAKNRLGNRIVAGIDADIDSAPLVLNGSPCPEFDQSANAWSARELSVQQELAQLVANDEHLRRSIADSEGENSNLKKAMLENRNDHQAQTIFLRSQLERQLSLLGAQEERSSTQLQQLQQAYQQDRQTQVQQNLLHIDALGDELGKIRLEASSYLRRLAECNAAFTVQLNEIHASFGQEKQALIQQQASREERLSAELAEVRQYAKSLQQRLDERELEFAEKFKSFELAHRQEKQALSELHVSREEAMSAELNEVRQYSKSLEQRIDKQEITFSEQIKELEQAREREKLELTRQLIVKEKILGAQLAERKLEFATQLEHLKSDFLTEKNAQIESGEVQLREFARTLAENRNEINKQCSEWYVAAQKMIKVIFALLNQVKYSHAIRWWQWKALFIGTKSPFAERYIFDMLMALTDPNIENSVQELPSPHVLDGLSGGVSDTTAANIQNVSMCKPASNQPLLTARSLDELLKFCGGEFISVAYQTILGRPPDKMGFRHYLSTLSSGASKFKIVTQLYSSDEAKSSGSKLVGLDDAIASSELYELMCHYDEPFVRKAYVAVLGREADDGGLRNYLQRVREGEERIEILAELRDSEEGKTRLLRIPGLDTAIASHRRAATSPLRMALQWFGMAQSLAQSQRNIRVTENQAYALDLRVCKMLPQHEGAVDRDSERSALRKLVDNESRFDAEWYLNQYPEAATSGIAPYEHYLRDGKKQGFHPFFDEDWYLSEYPEVTNSGLSAREHYERFGKKDGFYPRFDGDWYLARYPDVAINGADPLEHYMQHGKREGRLPAFSEFSADRNNYARWVKDFDTLTQANKETMIAQIELLVATPLISIVMPVYDPNPTWLKEAIDSVIRQIYTNWELCIADDASSNPNICKILKDYSQRDSRIKVEFRKENGHISAASNSAIAIAKGEWIALLDHDDVLREHALFWVADTINKDPNLRMIYSDEDKLNDGGVRFDPYFKPDWNQDLFYSHNMFSHLGVYHADLVRRVGGFRVGFEGSQDHDLALRCSENVSPKQIYHIPRILYHWRAHADSTSSSASAKPYAAIAGEKALNEHFQRLKVNATAIHTKFCYRVRYVLAQPSPLVSLIVPTRNGLKLLRQCIESILTKTTYEPFEIIIVDNGSDDPKTLRYLKELRSNSRIRVMCDDRPFNYSALNNAAVKIARGEIIGLINNDIEVISAEWLTEMVSHACRPDVGAVGARLWYSDDTLQHGGVILGMGGIGCHAHKGLAKDNPGYMGRAACLQSFSAVTAACLLVKKSIYESIGGLNEVELQVAFNDVDFCLRIRQAGFKNIWTPYAELYHHESATRGADDLIADPAYNPNLTLNSEDFSLAWPPRIDHFVGTKASNHSR